MDSLSHSPSLYILFFSYIRVRAEWQAVELTPWWGGNHDGAQGAISTKQNTCLY